MNVKCLHQQFSYSPQVQQLQSSADGLYNFSLLCLHDYVIHYNSQIYIISLKLKYTLKDN